MSTTNRSQQNKLKPLFSCALFRTCTGHHIATPTTSTPSSPHLLPPTLPPPPLPLPPPPTPPQPQPLPPSPPHHLPPSSSSSSSNSASHSFTQWRFPLTSSPLPQSSLVDTYDAANHSFSSGDRLSALRLLSTALSATATTPPICNHSLLTYIVESLLESSTSRLASKVLLALVLADHNRIPAVAAGAITASMEVVYSGSTTASERSLAAMELMCSTVAEAAEEVRVVEGERGALSKSLCRMRGRGRECAVGLLSSVYGGQWAVETPEAVIAAVVTAMQGDCSARGRRKGGQLLKRLQEIGRLDSFGVE